MKARRRLNVPEHAARLMIGGRLDEVPEERRYVVAWYMKRRTREVLVEFERIRPEVVHNPDTERLNKLDALSTPGLWWHSRESSTGRGYRLHQSKTPGYRTVREAIDSVDTRRSNPLDATARTTGGNMTEHDREKKARMLRTIAGLLENGVDPCDEFAIRLNTEGQDRKFFRPRSLHDLLCSIELMHYDVRQLSQPSEEDE